MYKMRSAFAIQQMRILRDGIQDERRRRGWEQGKELEIGLKKVAELKDIALRLAVSWGEQEAILKMLIESKKDAVRT